MPKRGETKGTKRLDDAMRKRVAQLLNEAIAERKWSVRQTHAATGIDIATLSRARDPESKQSATGIHFFMKLRDLLGMSIDDILGLPPMAAKAGKTEERARRDRLLAEAVVEAKKFGTPDHIISYVVKNWSMSGRTDDEIRTFWVRRFLQTWALTSLAPPISAKGKAWLESHPEPALAIVKDDEGVYAADLRREVG